MGCHGQRYCMADQDHSSTTRLPPGTQKPPYTTTHKGILEYRDKFDALKAKTLGDGTYWYLNLIARSPSRADKGKLLTPNQLCPTQLPNFGLGRGHVVRTKF